MNKYLCLLICILLCNFTACSPQKQEIVDSGKYYRIYKHNITEVSYEIYDSVGNIVMSETTDRPLKIDLLNENIVDISTGMGTGITEHKYYSVEQNVISEVFSYVIAANNELVAYINVPEEQPLKKRRVVVQNAFDKSLFYKEYELDFSKVDTPILDASFSEDGLLLEVIYLSGVDQVQVSEILSLE